VDENGHYKCICFILFSLEKKRKQKENRKSVKVLLFNNLNKGIC